MGSLACAAGWHDIPDANAVDANMRPRGKMFDRRPLREVGAQFADERQCMNFINPFNRRQDSWRAGCVSTLMLPLSCAMYMDGDCLIEIHIVCDSGRIRGLTPTRSPLRRASHDAGDLQNIQCEK